ncbi:MAG: FAD-binding oxidoreductase [Acidobacteriota bacterium]
MTLLDTPTLLETLSRILRPEDLLQGDAVRARSAAWGWTGADGCQALAVARPRTTEEVAAILRACHEQDQPVVTHGGVTGLVKGSVASTSELVLSLDRMTEIEEVDPLERAMTVQAGATLESVQQAARTAGFCYAVDLGARGQCTIGGNIATNAGGNNVIRWGMTRQQVLGLEAVLADGTVISDLSTMLKNNAGYDLKQLFIGTEGTLGVVTRAVLRMHTLPTSFNTALLALPDYASMHRVLRVAQQRLGADLAAFEVLWDDFYRLVTTPPAQGQPPLEQGFPLYVLVEAQGTSADRDGEIFRDAILHCMDEGLVADSVVAMSSNDRQRLWDLRDDVEQLARIAPFRTFDVSLPLRSTEEYVERVTRRIRSRWPEGHVVTFGHLGDGNIHFAIGVGEGGPKIVEAIEAAVYEPLADYGGSVSAEHGVGTEKQPYLHLTRDAAQIELMRTLKGALDPKNLLNPGRVLPPRLDRG